MRLNHILEKQICVKNCNLIFDIKEYDYTDKVNTYLEVINRFDYEYNQPKKSYLKYSKKLYKK